MIYLGKLLQHGDLRAFVFDEGVITVNDLDILNDPNSLLNDLHTTLNTFSNTTTSGLRPFDPYFISYTIIDCTHGREEVIRSTINSRPMKFQDGGYFAPFKVDPVYFRIGRHLILWQYRRYFDSTLESTVQDFNISRQAAYSGEFCASQYAEDKQYQGFNPPKRIFKIRVD